jgi:hypothetical protein
MAITTSPADYVWIAAQLNKLKITNPDGTISFRSHDAGLDYDDLLMLIETHHHFPSEIPDVERRRILADAIRSTLKAGEITDYSLKTNICKNIGLFSSKSPTDYVLVTSLSMKYDRALESLRFDQADFVFSPSLPQNFARQNRERFEATHPLHDLLPGATTVRVSIAARADFEAYHKVRVITKIDGLRIAISAPAPSKSAPGTCVPGPRTARLGALLTIPFPFSLWGTGTTPTG